MAVARGMTAELAKLLGGSAAPIYLLDDRRRLVYCNPIGAEWLSVPAEELLGKTCVFCSSAEAIDEPIAARLAGLCPPPEAFAGVRSVGQISTTSGDGKLNRRRAEFIPLADSAEAIAAVLVVAEPNNLPKDAAVPPGEASDESMLLHQRLQQLHHELRQLRRMERLLGDSPAMTRVRAQVELAAAGMASVLVVGPAGSGRQHIARAVHYARRDAEAVSLVPLSCSLLGTELLRSTLSVLLGPKGPTAAVPAPCS